MSTVRDRWLHRYNVARLKLKQAQQRADYAKRVLKRHPPAHKTVARIASHEGSFAVDWAWGKPNIPALKKAGVACACRYLSNDAPKNLTLAQAKALGAAGIDCVVVWETTANRALAGRNAGMADASRAAAMAKACGMPDDRPIYFAVDFDETPSQADDVARYFEGVNKILGVKRTGVYGGYYVVKRLFDAHLVSFGWQTYAWSGGQWDKRAQLQQYKNGQMLAGVSCDFDRAVADDFGQWRP